MQNIRPCPYCGGEVEVIKLIPKAKEPKDIYRIECRHCRRCVARGQGFAIEEPEEQQERIRQYQKEQRRLYYGEQ